MMKTGVFIKIVTFCLALFLINWDNILLFEILITKMLVIFDTTFIKILVLLCTYARFNSYCCILRVNSYCYILRDADNKNYKIELAKLNLIAALYYNTYSTQISLSLSLFFIAPALRLPITERIRPDVLFIYPLRLCQVGI